MRRGVKVPAALGAVRRAARLVLAAGVLDDLDPPPPKHRGAPPALGAGLVPGRFGVDPGPRGSYGPPLPTGVGYDIGAHRPRR